MNEQILDDVMYTPKMKLVHASKGKRFANFIIDQIIALIFVVIVMLLLAFLGVFSFSLK